MTEPLPPLQDPILIVEDDAGTALLLKNHLEGAGWAAEVVHSGRAAIAWLKERKAVMVLLDNGLPDMTGEELAQLVQLPPFIVTTGAGSERVAVALMKLGAKDYLVKDSLFLRSLRPAVSRVLKEVHTEGKLAKAEAALRETEGMYRLMAENSTDIISRHDSRGRFLYVSPSACRVLGLELQDLLGSSALDTAHPEDREILRESLRLLAQDRNPMTRRVRFRTCSGAYRWLDMNLTPILDERGVLTEFLASSRDVTEWVEAEQAVARSEARFRTLTELSPVGVYLTDEHGSCEYVNGRWCQLTGLSPVEARGSGRLQAVHPGDRTLVAQAWSRAVAEGLEWQQEFRILNRDGEERWAFDSAQPLRDGEGRIQGYIGATSDVTSIKRAQVALLESEIRNRAMLDAIPDLLFVNGPDGRFLDYHSPDSSVLAFPPEAFLGHTFGELFPSEFAALFQEMHNRVLETGQPLDFDYQLDQDGQSRTYEARKVLYSSNCVLTIVRDVTAKRELENALRHSQEKLTLALDGARMGVWDWMVDKGILEFDARHSEILGHGCRPMSLSMQECNGRVHPDDLPFVEKAMREQLCGQTAAWELEYRQQRTDGAWLWIHDQGRVVERDAQGEPVRAAGIILDITDRKLAQLEKQASEQSYRHLFEDASVGIATADYDSGKLLDCNRAFCALTGYDHDELVGRHQSALHPPADLGSDGYTRAYARLRNGLSRDEVQVRFLTREGAIREVDVRGGPVDVGGRKVVQGFFRDVTQELRERRERETTLLLLGLLNHPGTAQDLGRRLAGFLRDWSGCDAVGIRLKEGSDYPYFTTVGFTADFLATERILCAKDGGPARDGATGQQAMGCMCGRVLRRQTDPAQACFTSKGSFWTNDRSGLMAGAPQQGGAPSACSAEEYESVALIPLLLADEVVGLLQFHDRRRDRFTPELIRYLESSADQIAVTLAHRQSRAALATGEARWKAYFDLPLMGNAILDPAGRWLAFNERLCEMLRLTPEELVRREWTSLAHPGDPASFQELLPGGRDVFRAEKRYVRGDGSVLDAELAVSRVPDEDGSTAYYVAVLQDISERKVIEASLRESEERFRSLAEDLPAFVCTFLPDGTITYANPALLALYGRDGTGLHGVRLDELLDPEEAAVARQAIERLGLECPTETHEQSFLAADGSLHCHTWTNRAVCDGEGRVIRYQGVGFDITGLKMAEALMRDRERTLAHAARLADVAHWTWEGATDRMTLSPLFWKMMGLGEDRQLDKEGHFALVHPDDRASLAACWGAALRQERDFDTTFRIVLPDGQEKHVHAIAEINRDAAGRPLSALGMIQDITSRRAVESELLDSEARSRSLYHMIRLLCDNVPDLIWAKDLDKRYLFVNRAICEVLLAATDTEEPIGKNDLYFARRQREAHPEDPQWHTFGELCMDSDDVVLASRQAGRFQESGQVKGDMLHLDVSKAPFLDESGRMIGTVGCGRDVTREKQLELHRQQSEAARFQTSERLRIIAENLPALIAYVDPAGGVAFANQEWERWFGKSMEQVMQGSLLEVLGESVHAKVLPSFQTVMAGEEARFEDRLILPGGAARDVDARFIPHLDFEGRLLGCFVLVLDITDRKRVEETSRETGRLHAKAQMTAYIAHEINNPLGGIKNAFLLLADAVPVDHPHHAYIDLVRREIDRITGIVRTMYHAYRPDPGRMVEASLDVTFSDLISLLGPKCRQYGVILKVSLPEPPPKGRMAEGLIRQILFNLLLNATEASPQGGPVTMIGRREGEDLVIEVADEGTGIPEEIAGRVFEPDFTTKRDSAMSGLGLGLSTCRRLVESMSGTLDFRPNQEAGKGTVFTIRLPFATTVR